MCVCKGQDKERNVVSGNFAVNIYDRTPPQIEVSSDMAFSVPFKSGIFLTILNYSIRVVDIDNTNSSIRKSCNPPRGTFLQVKPRPITVKCLASDNLNNSNSTSFTVPVQNITYPAITIPHASFTAIARASAGIATGLMLPPISGF
jgi:hypothetical protein